LETDPCFNLPPKPSILLPPAPLSFSVTFVKADFLQKEREREREKEREREREISVLSRVGEQNIALQTRRSQGSDEEGAGRQAVPLQG
jgi:hypothetical protein